MELCSHLVSIAGQLSCHVTGNVVNLQDFSLTRTQASHVTSLNELLGAHGLVKVQLNAVNSDVFAVGQELANGTGQSSGVTGLLQCSTCYSKLNSLDAEDEQRALASSEVGAALLLCPVKQSRSLEVLLFCFQVAHWFRSRAARCCWEPHSTTSTSSWPSQSVRWAGQRRQQSARQVWKRSRLHQTNLRLSHTNDVRRVPAAIAFGTCWAAPS